MASEPGFSFNFIKLPVADLAAQLAFFTAGFGMEVRNRMRGEGFEEVMLGVPGEPQMLILIAYADGRRSAHGTIGFVTGDAAGARAKLLAAGAKPEGEILEFPGVRACFVRDPEDNQLELIEFAAA